VLNDLLTIIRWHNMEIDFAGEVVRHEARQKLHYHHLPGWHH
jgi:hypothetical protein